MNISTIGDEFERELSSIFSTTTKIAKNFHTNSHGSLCVERIRQRCTGNCLTEFFFFRFVNQKSSFQWWAHNSQPINYYDERKKFEHALYSVMALSSRLGGLFFIQTCAPHKYAHRCDHFSSRWARSYTWFRSFHFALSFNACTALKFSYTFRLYVCCCLFRMLSFLKTAIVISISNRTQTSYANSVNVSFEWETSVIYLHYRTHRMNVPFSNIITHCYRANAWAKREEKMSQDA